MEISKVNVVQQKINFDLASKASKVDPSREMSNQLYEDLIEMYKVAMKLGL